jgi:hypothetical protein
MFVLSLSSRKTNFRNFMHRKGIDGRLFARIRQLEPRSIHDNTHYLGLSMATLQGERAKTRV